MLGSRTRVESVGSCVGVHVNCILHLEHDSNTLIAMADGCVNNERPRQTVEEGWKTDMLNKIVYSDHRRDGDW